MYTITGSKSEFPLDFIGFPNLPMADLARLGAIRIVVLRNGTATSARSLLIDDIHLEKVVGNQSPQINETPTATPSIATAGIPNQLRVSASDPEANSLYYSWTAACAGNFRDPLAQNPIFTPAASRTCRAFVDITDRQGGHIRSSVLLTGFDSSNTTTVIDDFEDPGILIRVGNNEIPNWDRWVFDGGTVSFPNTTGRLSKTSMLLESPSPFSGLQRVIAQKGFDFPLDISEHNAISFFMTSAHDDGDRTVHLELGFQNPDGITF